MAIGLGSYGAPALLARREANHWITAPQQCPQSPSRRQQLRWCLMAPCWEAMAHLPCWRGGKPTIGLQPPHNAPDHQIESNKRRCLIAIGLGSYGAPALLARREASVLSPFRMPSRSTDRLSSEASPAATSARPVKPSGLGRRDFRRAKGPAMPMPWSS